MKLLKLSSSITLFAFLLFFGGAQVSSCTKTTTIHDTVTVVQYDLTDGLVAYYNFNGGNLNDSSGDNNTIVYSNATPTADRFGRANNAYLFDGSTSYMQVNDNPSISPANGITIMAIVNVGGFYDGPCQGNQILGKGWPGYADGFYCLTFVDAMGCTAPLNPAGEYFGATYGNNNPLGSAAGAESDSVFIQTGKWYNVVYTFDGATSKIYIDGALKSAAQKTVAFTPNNQPLTIGRHLDPQFPYWFNGAIDEIRIYNKALSSGAVAQLNLLKE